MYLRTIQGRGIKGCNFELQLQPLAVLVGASKSGKTAVLESIRLALLGHTPTLGKTNASIFELASGNSMLVIGTTDTGLQIERVWSRSGKSVSQQQRISHGIPNTPVVMMDANDYFSRSERGQLEMVFSMMNLGDTPLELRAREINTALATAQNKATTAALKTLQPVPGENFQQWLERALTHVDDYKKAEVALVRRLTGTSQTLATQQVANEADTDSAQLETRLTAARDKLEQARVAKAALEAEDKQRATGAQQRMALRQQIEKNRTQAARLAEAEKKVAEIAAALADAGNPDVMELRTRLRAVDAERATAKANMDAMARMLEDLKADEAEALSHKTCPVCSTNKPTWKQNAQKQFAARRERIEAQRAAAEKEFIDHQKTTLELTTLLDRVELLHYSRTTAAEDLAEAKHAQEAITTAESQLQALGQPDGAAEDKRNQDVVAAADAYQDASDEVRELEAKQQAVANARADAKALQQAHDDRVAAEAKAAQLKAGLAYLEEVRNRFMDTGFKPLLDAANEFVKGVLETPLEYEGGRLGRRDMRTGNWINTSTFSGTERAATYAAISAALGSQSPMRVVVVDEMGNMDLPNKQTFIANVARAIEAKLIDQFIGVDVDGRAYTDLVAQAKAEERKLPLQILSIGA